MIPRLILFIGVVFIFGSACTHDVYIRSNPAGAKIYVNDEFIGKSPAVYEESIGARETVEVRAEKEGFATKTMVLEKSIPCKLVHTDNLASHPLFHHTF